MCCPSASPGVTHAVGIALDCTVSSSRSHKLVATPGSRATLRLRRHYPTLAAPLVDALDALRRRHELAVVMTVVTVVMVVVGVVGG